MSRHCKYSQRPVACGGLALGRASSLRVALRFEQQDRDLRRARRQTVKPLVVITHVRNLASWLTRSDPSRSLAVSTATPRIQMASVSHAKGAKNEEGGRGRCAVHWRAVSTDTRGGRLGRNEQREAGLLCQPSSGKARVPHTKKTVMYDRFAAAMFGLLRIGDGRGWWLAGSWPSCAPG